MLLQYRGRVVADRRFTLAPFIIILQPHAAAIGQEVEFIEQSTLVPLW